MAGSSSSVGVDDGAEVAVGSPPAEDLGDFEIASAAFCAASAALAASRAALLIKKAPIVDVTAASSARTINTKRKPTTTTLAVEGSSVGAAALTCASVEYIANMRMSL
jgi:hypothetical protein